MFSEIITGVVTGSLTLLSTHLHMMSDLIAHRMAHSQHKISTLFNIQWYSEAIQRIAIQRIEFLNEEIELRECRLSELTRLCCNNDSESESVAIDIPNSLRNTNLFVQCVSDTITQSQPFYDHQLTVQIKENYGKFAAPMRGILSNIDTLFQSHPCLPKISTFI